MIVPDTNLIVYARDEAAPRHQAANRWWTECLNGEDRVGLPWAVIVSFLRLASSPHVFAEPVPIGELLDEIESWLRLPNVRVVEPTSSHLQAMRSIAGPLGLGGDLMSDVHLAALALEYGAVVHTADRDFARFRGVRWFNPLD